MLRWNSTNPKNGAPVLGFGIDAENVRRLQAGQPIIASVSIEGKPCQIVIHYGESAEAMALEFSTGKAMVDVIPQALDREPTPASELLPPGRISNDDEGEIMLRVGKDERGVVIIDFGKRVSWVGMPVDQAREFATVILLQAGQPEGDGN